MVCVGVFRCVCGCVCWFASFLFDVLLMFLLFCFDSRCCVLIVWRVALSVACCVVSCVLRGAGCGLRVVCCCVAVLMWCCVARCGLRVVC